MGVINYFEKIVEKKAQRMLKNKRMFAWLFLFFTISQGIKLLFQIKKLWDEDWEYAWRTYKKERTAKKEKCVETQCPSGYSKE